MELWGGIECTVNRVGDRYRDQTRLTGHHDRFDDLQRVAALGVRRLRYPVLWERVAPDRPDAFDWAWTDARLEEIARLGMSPIVGLLHHGSGPSYTSLVADDFVQGFTTFAAAAARRCPHVGDWTPINEPLTTARFSALYGHWYPHARDERLFWLALVNQVAATAAAMRAIRAVNPAARLIQTEDLGDVDGTSKLAGAVAHLRDRRWITWDLLAGRVTRDHPLWERLVDAGLGDRVRALADAPCPPDVVGINYYPTSDRFIDHRHARYDAARDLPYFDGEAVRVVNPAPAGLAGLLRQAWTRYRIPVAVTERHLGCTRDEQLRWLVEGWRQCREARDEGVPVEAMTAWALFGNVDWCGLLTVDADRHEPGAFDVRGGRPRPTALAGMLRRLADDPLADPATVTGVTLSDAGWWRRDIRLEHPPVSLLRPATAVRPRPAAAPPLLITGGGGRLGQAFAGAARLRDLAVALTGREQLDIADPLAVTRALEDHRPWAVINAAGWVRVDEAEDDAAGCDRANADGAATLAAACAERGIPFVTFSSDLVFDGRLTRAHDEQDVPAPISVYGRSKAAAETRVLAAHPAALVVRTAAFFSAYDSHNFARQVETALRGGVEIRASDEHRVTPTYVPDLAHAALDLLIDGERGIWHLTSGEAMTWLAFGRAVADALGLDPALVLPGDAELVGWRAPRPRNAALGSRHGALLPPFTDALARFAAVRGRAAATAADRQSVRLAS